MKQEMYDVSPQYKHNTIFLLSRVYILELCFPIFYTCHLNLFLYTRHISILYIIRTYRYTRGIIQQNIFAQSILILLNKQKSVHLIKTEVIFMPNLYVDSSFVIRELEGGNSYFCQFLENIMNKVLFFYLASEAICVALCVTFQNLSSGCVCCAC